MHIKTDSEATSASSPRRPLYFVQSPSRDSNYGEKTSFHSSPFISPMGSPPPSNSSNGHHSRESSTTRFSGTLKPGSRSVFHGGRNAHTKSHKPWQDYTMIEEEAFLEDGNRRDHYGFRCYLLLYMLGFIVLFSVFSLILWGVSRSQKPQITLKSIRFEEFRIQAGSDATGVSTDMITVNSTVKITYRNTGTFFGIHVTSTPFSLSYSQILIASGSAMKFYQKRKSQRTVAIHVAGSGVPLYGGSAGMSSSSGLPTLPIPLNLEFSIRSKAYVLGKLVKPEFKKKIRCNVSYDPKRVNTPLSLKNSCTYD